MKKASRSAMQKWRRSTSKAMRSIPNGITPSSHGATKPQVEALILPRRLSPEMERAGDHIERIAGRAFQRLEPDLLDRLSGIVFGDFVQQFGGKRRADLLLTGRSAA